MNLLATSAGLAATGPRFWWESRLFLGALILLSAVPLIYPAIPPLVDLFGHMGRYRVQLDLGTSPWLGHYFDFRWAAIGNLGVDLLVVPLSRLFGLELAVKLVVLSIPPLTAAGFLWVAREVHHRLPPTALFALPFVYGHPFLYGFVNFALAMSLAFLAFGLWLRLASIGRLRLRAWLFAPVSVIIFFVHVYGWGMLGLLAFSAEAVRQHDSGRRWFISGLRAALHASVMTLPLLFMLAWRGTTSGRLTWGWFEWELKWEWIYSALRDRFMAFDIASVALAGLVLAYALFSRRLAFSRNLAFSVLVLLAAFLALPWTLFGSAFADMRLAPYLLAVALLAIRFTGDTHPKTARALAVLGLGFFLVRLGSTTLSLAMAADDQSAKLRALNHVPMGAAIVNLAGQPCQRGWALPRNSHLGAMAIVRRHAFSNDQWTIEGANLLSVRIRGAGPFVADPSQIVRPAGCPTGQVWSVDRALAAIPRQTFDYVWLIDPPAHDPRLLAGMTPIWRSSGSLLYAVEKPRDKSQP